MENALGNPHARRCVSTVDMDGFQTAFAREMPLQVAAECFGQHCFAAADRACDDRSCSSTWGGDGTELACQRSLQRLPADQFIGDMVIVKRFGVGDDQTRSDSVEIARHGKVGSCQPF